MISIIEIPGNLISLFGMMQWIKRWGIPGAAGIILLVGIALQVISSTRTVSEGSLTLPLEEIIPSDVAGWEVEDMDLGPTESVTERSMDLLKLDDFIHRSYTRGDKNFSIYVAYWKPGKMPVRLVNQHSPDRCWTQVGWSCTDRKWNVEKFVGEIPLQPAQWGVYELENYTNHAYFWHIVGGEVHSYGGERINTRTSLTTVFEDLTKFGLNVHREQFFVRIVSSQSIDGLWEEPGFMEVMEVLAELCLAETQPDATVAMQ